MALYEKGYIHKDSYLVNWCPRCGTAISDLEVAYRDMPGTLNYVRYDVDGGGRVTIATTRPGDHARRHGRGGAPGRRAVQGPRRQDGDPASARARAQDRGRRACRPCVRHRRLKITPAHDLTDFDIGRTHGLDSIQAIGQDGRITAAGGPYAGLEVEEAAERVVADLRALGALEKVEDYPHSVATCDRCGTPIEPLISEQWFMAMDELKKPATDVVRDGKVKFTPERWGRVYVDWMDNLRPWCISRQLWWGHQLPVWYCPDGHMTVAETAPHACAECGSTELTRETDVLDTWFSSALWPFATFGWPEQTADLAYFYPTNVLSTARDIIFLWVARMIMMGIEFMDDIPFDDVYIHSVIQAPDGRRMSKSLGTGIDPLKLIDEHGADATRFGLLLMSSTQDVRFSEEKIAMGRGFANKLWNAARFVLLGSEGYAAHGDLLFAEADVLGAAHEEETEARGVGAVLVDELQRVDARAEALAHAPAVGGLDHRVDVDIVEGDVVHELDAHHDHARDPQEDDVARRAEHVRRVEVGEVGGLVRPAEGGERPQRRAEDRHQRVRLAGELGGAALGAGVRRRLGHCHVTVRAVPHRQLVPPPELPADAPRPRLSPIQSR